MSFTKKNGAEYVIDYVDAQTKSYWFSDDNGEEHLEDFVEHIRYGFLLMPKDYISKDVVIKDCGNLYIGGKLVYDYITTCERLFELKGNIPAYYCIRTERGTETSPFLSFECGFDLQLTKFWANGNYFDTIEECFSFLQSKYGDFVITLEESMRID